MISGYLGKRPKGSSKRQWSFKLRQGVIYVTWNEECYMNECGKQDFLGTKGEENTPEKCR